MLWVFIIGVVSLTLLCGWHGFARPDCSRAGTALRLFASGGKILMTACRCQRSKVIRKNIPDMNSVLCIYLVIFMSLLDCKIRNTNTHVLPLPPVLWSRSHMRNFIYKRGCRCNPWLAKCNPKVFKCNPKPKPLLIWWKHQNHPTTCCIKEDQLKHYITV